jgi:hypothetical protein
MKTSLSLLGLLSTVGAFSAAPVRVPTTTTTSSTSSTTLHAVVSRRDCWKSVVAAAVTATVASTVRVSPAHAALNFDQVQDLLGTPQDTAAAWSGGGGRPTFLTEPTAEFKENEAKAGIFKRKQLQVKQAFTTALDKIATDPNDENALALDLDELRRQVKNGGGLPEGIVKDDVVRQIRRRKSKKYWPVNVEIAYQDLMDEIRYQQSPNKVRDVDNPM